MNDLISRQAAITIPVTPKEDREYQTYNLDDAYEQAWNDLQKRIEQLPSAQQWVLCSDRLPNSEEQVIVTCHDISGDSAFDYTSCGWVTRNGEYWIVENEMNPYVIAWAPFPKPYKVRHERKEKIDG